MGYFKIDILVNTNQDQTGTLLLFPIRLRSKKLKNGSVETCTS